MERNKTKNPSDEPQTLWTSEEAAHISVEKWFVFFFFLFGFLAVFWWTAFKYYAMFSFKWTLLKIPESILQRASTLTAMMNKLSNTEHSHISKYSVSAGLTKRIMPKLAVRGVNDPSPLSNIATKEQLCRVRLWTGFHITHKNNILMSCKICLLFTYIFKKWACSQL